MTNKITIHLASPRGFCAGVDRAIEIVKKTILEKTNKFHQIIENKKKSAEQKIVLMKENAIKDIKNISVKISMEAVEHIIKNSIDKNKLERLYTKSLEQTKASLKHIKA